MPTTKDIVKGFVIFIASFLLLIFLFNLKPVKKAHASFFWVSGTILTNILNPHFYTQFRPGAPPNPRGFDVTFNLWDKRQIKKKLNRKTISKIKPSKIILQKHRELITIPTLFLIALILASPIRTKPRIIRAALALLIFYLFLVFYLGYRFELAATSGVFEVNSIWQGLCWLGSLGGTIDNIYIIIIFIWGVLFIPPIIQTFRNRLAKSI